MPECQSVRAWTTAKAVLDNKVVVTTVVGEAMIQNGEVAFVKPLRKQPGKGIFGRH